MGSKTKLWPVATCAAAILAVPIASRAAEAGQAASTSQDEMAQSIATMQTRIDELQKQLDEMREQQRQASMRTEDDASARSPSEIDSKTEGLAQSVEPSDDATDEESVAGEGIKVGGAVRFQYSYESYDSDNRRRNGDTDFDIFRLDLNGRVAGIELSAQWRWFEYMNAVHHAWIGYDFSEASQVQLGITRLPFGVQPFNSHNYFFSSNYYIGLEDNYRAGIEYIYDDAPWNVQLAFFKNDALGGVDGFVSDRADSYSYNIVGVRDPDEGNFDDPRNPIGTYNTTAARAAYTFTPTEDLRIEVGASGLQGVLDDGTSRTGDYRAYAVHLNAFYKQLNIQAQASHYDYDVDGGADRLAVGAYAFYDSIAARAHSYTFNLAYDYPVSWGPISNLQFYNDYSLITNKSGQLPDTFMNVSGVSVTAGNLFTYFDFVTARNQPFVGGTMAGDGEIEHRFNINFGFYF